MKGDTGAKVFAALMFSVMAFFMLHSCYSDTSQVCRDGTSVPVGQGCPVR